MSTRSPNHPDSIATWQRCSGRIKKTGQPCPRRRWGSHIGSWLCPAHKRQRQQRMEREAKHMDQDADQAAAEQERVSRMLGDSE